MITNRSKSGFCSEMHIARLEQYCVLTAKQQHRASRCDQGDGPPWLRHTANMLSKLGVKRMWFLPLSITLEVKKNRISWSLTIRFSFSLT